MYEKVKALTQECYEKKALGDPAYTSLMQILKRLRATVGETFIGRGHRNNMKQMVKKQRWTPRWTDSS